MRLFLPNRAPLLSVLAITAILATSVAATRSNLNTPSAPTATAPGDEWLDGLKGAHRELFDTPTANGGVPLVHLMMYYDTYKNAYGEKDANVNGILTFYAGTTFYGVNDAMWSKYRIGEFLEANDPKTNKPATSNPWRVAPVALGMTLPQASVEAMQKRGATFIICNNALTVFSGMLAQARGLSPDSVNADLKAHILPGVTLVPGMVVAIEKAQGRGIAYNRQ
jgi:intracellular sulfur oxidation DsrE/DsrF family protein